jgi:hypothetical protein
LISTRIRRHAVAILLAGLAITASAATKPSLPSTKPSSSGTGEQLHERRLARLDRERAWFKTQLVDAYEKSGVKDPKWDADAREMLRHAAASFAGGRRILDTDMGVVRAGRRAIKAGCKDPLVNLVFAEGVRSGGVFDTEMAECIWTARQGLPATEYGPFWKALAWEMSMTYASGGMAGVNVKEVETGFQALPALLVEVAKDPDVPGQRLSILCRNIGNAAARALRDRKRGWDMIETALAPHVTPARLLSLKGEFLIKYAWDARGSGWANSVTPDGQKLFQERLGDARTTLTKAWEADPSDPSPAASLITVEMGDGGSRKEMEKWFDRARRADPADSEAYAAKIEFIQPKWHGEPEDLLRFAQECLRRGKPDSAELFFGVYAYDEFGQMLGNQRDAQGRTFYEHPEFWKAVQAVYEPYLKAHPTSLGHRAEYVKFAFRAGKFDIAAREWEVLGNDAPLDAIDPPTQNAIMEKVEEMKRAKQPAK